MTFTDSGLRWCEPGHHLRTRSVVVTAPIEAGEKVSVVLDGARVWCVVHLALAGGRLLRLETPGGQRVWRRA